ncbi:MAG: Glu-tRNA(Gln) amidotransferase subunit GatE [Deltaproteobacteria bacterium]|nr:Glu-tRNA(Gln) amidotransferase subunit GatE [Deltaproteobacteria bacterium]
MNARKSPFDMDANEFRAWGFRSGLEVHQQLDTRKKLFCHCPVGLIGRGHDAELLRHMRPTLSELGEYDGTALMEFKTKKQIRYQLFRDAVCTYEMDDTPPFPINQEALDIGIRISLMLGCTLVDELHVSRKQYLDGSIPTGFQRTAIVGINGSIPLGNRELGILQLGLEEDACREVEDRGHTIVFRTDRLSTPLVEVVTEAGIRDPLEVTVAAEAIRRLLRASERVRRGAGATRADVNVSIEGGTRVEIKGVSRIAWFERLTRVEAWRQRRLLDIRQQLKVRGVSSKSFNASVKDITSACRSIRIPILRKALKRGDMIMGVCLPGFGGLLSQEVQPGVPFEQEFSGRVRVIACLDEIPNLIHTDDEALLNQREREVRKLRDLFSARHSDVVVVTWGPAEDAETAAEEIRLRALDAIKGVPNETRQAFPDGTTDFERILPGADRMYPDTDSPPVRLDQARVERIQKDMPERPWELQARYRKMGLSAELADDVLLQGPPSLFERLVERSGASPVLVAELIAQRLVGMLRRRVLASRPAEKTLLGLCTLLAEQRLFREGLPELLRGIAAAGDGALELAAIQLCPTPAPLGEIDTVTERVADAGLAQCRSADREARLRFAMGRAMEHLRGRAPGKLVSDRLESKLGSARR